MNVERIRQLADVIEKQPHTKITDSNGFNMGNWDHDCGTPSCICGWANHLRSDETGTRVNLGNDEAAANWLGLHVTQAIALFEPEHPDDDIADMVGTDWWDDITPKEAAAVLRHLADTGVVDWSLSTPEQSNV